MPDRAKGTPFAQTAQAASAPRPPRRQAGPSLAWQFGALLLAALLASHLIVMALLQQAAALIHPISREQAMATLGIAYALAAAEPAGGSNPAIWRNTDGGGPQDTRLWLASAPAVAPFEMQAEETRLAHDLQRQLGIPADGGRAWIQVERISGRDARSSLFSLAAWQPLRLRASLALPHGQWLNASVGVQGRYEWSSIALFALPASVLPVLLAAVLLARRLVRPLRRLIEATGQLRYGAAAAPLPLRGPREARELTSQFNAMQQRLASHRDERTRMLAAISHDLRTPVTALRIQAELIDDDALRRDMLASIAELQAMVEETLDFARADARNEAPQTVNIAQLAQRLAARYRQLGHAVGTRRCPGNAARWRCGARWPTWSRMPCATPGTPPCWRNPARTAGCKSTWRTAGRALPAARWSRCSSRSARSTRRAARSARVWAWDFPSPAPAWKCRAAA